MLFVWTHARRRPPTWSSSTTRSSSPRAPSSATTWPGAPAVAPFFGAGGWDLEALAAAAERRPASSGRCAAVADALARQQEARGAPRAAERARALAEPGATAVVTGQQAGPLRRAAVRPLQGARRRSGGAAARGAARAAGGARLLGGLGRPRLRGGPLRRPCSTRSGAIRTLRYAPRREPVGQPAWAIALDDTIAGARRGAAAGPARRPWPRRDARRAWRSATGPARRSSAAFARLVSRLLPDLVVLDPSDPELKAPDGPRAGARDPRGLAHLAPRPRGGRGAPRRGLPPAGAGAPGLPEPLRRSSTASGARSARERRRRGARDARAMSGGGGRAAPRADPRAGARACSCGPWPRTRSCPRPPTWAARPRSPTTRRSAPSYAHFGIPRPALVPRPSLTLVEPPQARALEAEQLTLADLAGRPRGARLALGARGLPRRGGGVRAHARGDRARDGGGGGGAGRPTTRRCARPPTRPAGGRSTRSRRSTRRRCAPSRSATRRGRAPAPHARRALPGRLAPGARPRPRGRPRPSRPRAHLRARASAWTPSPAATR